MIFAWSRWVTHQREGFKKNGASELSEDMKDREVIMIITYRSIDVRAGRFISSQG